MGVSVPGKLVIWSKRSLVVKLCDLTQVEVWMGSTNQWLTNGWINHHPNLRVDGYDVRPFSAPKRKLKQPGSRGAMGQGGNCGVWLWGDKIQMIKQLGLGRMNRDIHKCRLCLGFSYDWEKYISKKPVGHSRAGRMRGFLEVALSKRIILD